MALWHNATVLQSTALAELGQFVLAWHKQWGTGAGTPDFERFERELHIRVMALERECLEEELAHYDVVAEEIEVAGVAYGQPLCSPETYLSAAGSITVSRHLYRPAGRSSKSICPLELRVGIVRGYWTPRAARQATFTLAHLTPGDSEALFAELDGMRPTRPSLDRLPKEWSTHWEAHRQDWEAALRAQETVPIEAVVAAFSVDGVLAPMKAGAATRQAKRDESGKHASGPAGHQEVGCGTVALYDAHGERLETVRYGRMPESKKPTLQGQLAAEGAALLAVRPDLRRVLLSDGAKDNWRLLRELEQLWPAPPAPSVEIVDFWHACEHLKKACDSAWGESTPRSQAEFAYLKTLLREDDQGAERVVRVLRYHYGRARGRKRERLEDELTFFRNQRARMHYAQYLREGLPIASGVIEATCKTLVTERLKRSGMAWTPRGGQAILTLRSLIQSDRWPAAWELLRDDFCQPVAVRESHRAASDTVRAESADARQSVRRLAHGDYAALPCAA